VRIDAEIPLVQVIAAPAVEVVVAVERIPGVGRKPELVARRRPTPRVAFVKVKVMPMMMRDVAMPVANVMGDGSVGSPDCGAQSREST